MANINKEYKLDCSDKKYNTSDVVSGIHNFSGNNPSSFRLWIKHLKREAWEKQPIDDQYMRK